MWVWQNESRPTDRVGTTECPISFVSGESVALLEDFYAHELLGAGEKMLHWPARRVDAFLLLKAELKKVELGSDGRR